MDVRLGTMQNYFRWSVGLVLIVIAVYGNSYYTPEQPLLYRTLGVIVLLALSAVVLITTTQGKGALKLILESRTEIRRVIWPSRPETTQTTLIVIVAITIAGLILWGLDSLFGWVTASLLG
ncbi:MAG: preprotein translocase subunit SecE [Pseudomonadota bacterium]|nr:preprotein translocase subunit SecE [Pseudomonadota bacterium]